MKPYLFFVTSHLPSANSRQAGEKTAYRNLLILAEKYSVVLILLSGSRLDDDPAICRAFCVEQFFIKITLFDKIISFLIHPWAPFILLTRSSCASERAFTELFKRYDPVRVHCEWVQAGFSFYLFKRLRKMTVYFSLNIHDVALQFTERQSKSSSFLRRIIALDVSRVKRSERILYNFADKIIVPSLKDGDFIASKLGVDSRKICTVPLQFSKYGELNDFSMIDVLFWGAINRPENEQAVSILIKDIYPKLKAFGYLGSVHVVGANPPKWLMRGSFDGVKVSGFVLDPAAEFVKCGIAVFPLLTGAGVKVKVLECLAFGLPVVTTYIGAEGIDLAASGVVVADDIDQIPHLVIGLLHDRALRMKKSEMGIKYALSYGSNELIKSIL